MTIKTVNLTQKRP